MKASLRFLICTVMIITLRSAEVYGQDPRSSTSSGSWTQAGTWGSQTAPDRSSGIITINHTVTVPASSFNATNPLIIDQLVIGSSGTLVIEDGAYVKIIDGPDDDFRIDGKGSMKVNGNLAAEKKATLSSVTGDNLQFSVKRSDATLRIVGQICGAVETKIVVPGTTMNPKTGKRPFQYAALIYEAAGTTTNDHTAITALKIQKFWDTYYNDLLCSSLSWNIDNSSPVKLAVSNGFTEFIRDVARWKVNFNIKDHDGTTVMDYIDAEISNTSDETMIGVLKGYYNTLKAAGAKHSREF